MDHQRGTSAGDTMVLCNASVLDHTARAIGDALGFGLTLPGPLVEHALVGDLLQAGGRVPVAEAVLGQGLGVLEVHQAQPTRADVYIGRPVKVDELASALVRLGLRVADLKPATAQKAWMLGAKGGSK